MITIIHYTCEKDINMLNGFERQTIGPYWWIVDRLTSQKILYKRTYTKLIDIFT